MPSTIKTRMGHNQSQSLFDKPKNSNPLIENTRWEKPFTRKEIFKTVADNAFNLPNHKIDPVAFVH